MEVILTDEVESLGYTGDIVVVKDGYARNYLLPRGLAVKATKGAKQDRERIAANLERIEAQKRDEFEKLAGDFREKSVIIYKPAGSGSKLYGSVTAKDIAEALKEQYDLDIDRKHLILEAPVKTLGEHEVEIRLSKDVRGTLTLLVKREGADAADEGIEVLAAAAEVYAGTEAAAAVSSMVEVAEDGTEIISQNTGLLGSFEPLKRGARRPTPARAEAAKAAEDEAPAEEPEPAEASSIDPSVSPEVAAVQQFEAELEAKGE